MYNLILGLSLLLFCSGLILYVPFVGYPAERKIYFFSFLFLSCFSISMYSFVTDFTGLRYWLNGGKEHYKLLENFQSLGGLDGAIEKIEKQLAMHPDDKEGKELLKKLLEVKSSQSR